MKNNIEIKFGVNGYSYIYVGGHLVYKSKDANKVKTRYEQMTKIQDNRERKIEQFRDNPYR